jgi:nucleotide-binding universal stress UspA family protein
MNVRRPVLTRSSDASGRPDLSRTEAVDAAVRLLQGRAGCIDVVWVAHLSNTVRLSADVMVEMEAHVTSWSRSFAPRRPGSCAARELERRHGIIADKLIAVAAGLRDARPRQSVVIVIGNSSHATHCMIGSVAVSLARHAPVPLVIVP